LDRYQVSDILDHPPAKPDDLPDILYIVVDAYSREDILAELYAYDNSAFVRFLEDHGFYVTRGARANYADTEFSIASSLNMIHIDTLPQYLYENAGINTLEGIKQVAGELVRKNALLDILHTFGYEVVGFESGFGATQVEKIDLWMAPPEEEEINFWQLSFEIMLLDSSLADTFLKFRKADGSPLQRVFDLHRTRILYTLDNLPKSIDGDGPRFVYAHIISPHTPFVFGPNGEELEAENPFTLMDADPGGEGNINYYRDQVHFLNSRLEEVIPQILDHRSRPLMIILQSDHGGKVYQGPAPDTEKRMKLLLPILSAYYVPQLEESAFYPTLTPVNEFRIILNDLFGTDLERLEDTSYLLENIDGVYQFVDGCKLYDACPTR
jgi:hypothetical protein